MHEAEIVERVALVTGDQTPEVAEPGAEPFDLLPALEASERTAVLRLGPDAAPAMGSDHLDAQRSQRRVQRVGVIGAIPDQALGEWVEEAGVEGGGDQVLS